MTLDAELRDPDGYIWSEVFSPGCRFCKLPPNIPPLRPGLLRWDHFDGRGEAVLFSDGHVSVKRNEGCGGWSMTHHKSVDACRTAGYEFTQEPDDG